MLGTYRKYAEEMWKNGIVSTILANKNGSDMANDSTGRQLVPCPVGLYLTGIG